MCQPGNPSLKERGQCMMCSGAAFFHRAKSAGLYFFLLDYVARGMRLDVGWQHVQPLHGAVVARQIVLHHLHGLKLLQASLLGYLVLAVVGVVLEMAHIGDVAHVAHFVARGLEIAEQP